MVRLVGEQEVIVVPGGTSGAGGFYSGLTAPQPVSRRRKKEDGARAHNQDMQDMIDIIAIMTKSNII